MRQFRQLLVVVAIVSGWAWVMREAQVALGEVPTPAALPSESAVTAGEHLLHAMQLDRPVAQMDALEITAKSVSPEWRRRNVPLDPADLPQEAWFWYKQQGSRNDGVWLYRRGNRARYVHCLFSSAAGPDIQGTWIEKGSKIRVRFEPTGRYDAHFERRGSRMFWRDSQDGDSWKEMERIPAERIRVDDGCIPEKVAVA